MTALQVIIKEAKAIRKKSPKMEWKKAVAQASAIYASKHKGKSPVGKKKAVKKAAKKVGKIDPNKAFKKQMQVSKSVNTKYKNWEFPVPPVYTGNWSVTTWGEWIRKHGRKIGAVKKHAIKKKAVKKVARKKAVKKVGSSKRISAVKKTVLKKPISESRVLHEIDKVKHDIKTLESMQKQHMMKKHKSSIGATIRKKHSEIKKLLKKY